MFLDKAKIKVTSGAGGNGMVAWRREKYVDMGGPAGGDGGKGGNVYLQAENSMTTLLDFKHKSIYKADNGDNGRGKSQHGRQGQSLVIKVPCGTIIKDIATNKIIGDLKEHGQQVMIAQGGRGGRGNCRFSNSVRQAPQFCEPGEPGIERDLELELKLIADVGLLGMPNAGKSTFISVISAAKPKIADYPFTTLTPNLGVVKKPNGDGFVVADIPGLIEGASDGTGLGHEFLRHVERNKFLVHLVDITEEDPVKNFNTINEELAKYGGRLAEIEQIVALNKIDSVSDEDIEKYQKEFETLIKDKVYLISAATKQGIDEILNKIIQLVEEIPTPEIEVEIEEDHAATDHDDSSYAVYKEDKETYMVAGGRIERLVSVTDSRNADQIVRLQNIMNSMGIFDALKEAGIKDGNTVRVGHIEFLFYD